MTGPAQATPDRVMQFITGGWTTAILGSAAKHGIFNALEGDGDDAKGIANAGPIRWLDVGGGSGVWSAVWLSANKQAKGVQLDWPVVNQIAKGFVGNFGVADRFETIDGDFHATDFGSGQYDYAVYGNIA